MIGSVEAVFEPPPTGSPVAMLPLVDQDIFLNFGDEREAAALGDLIPIVGNFDPPITSGQEPRPIDQFDVNFDGDITPLDALLIINELNANPYDRSHRPALDTNNDQAITPLDVLLVINWLNSQSRIAESAESLSPSESSRSEVGLLVADAPSYAAARRDFESRDDGQTSDDRSTSRGTLNAVGRAVDLPLSFMPQIDAAVADIAEDVAKTSDQPSEDDGDGWNPLDTLV